MTDFVIYRQPTDILWEISGIELYNIGDVTENIIHELFTGIVKLNLFLLENFGRKNSQILKQTKLTENSLYGSYIVYIMNVYIVCNFINNLFTLITNRNR